MTRGVLAATAVLVLAAAVGGCAGRGAPADTLRVGVAYDVGGAGNPVNALTRTGLGQVSDKLGTRLVVHGFEARTTDTDEDRYDRLVILCQSGYDPVLAVGYLYAGPNPATGPLARAAAACPRTRFASVDDATVSAPNVADLAFADADGSYLVGVAAGLATRTGVVGFVGGCQLPQLTAFETGYRAGVAAARPGIRVRPVYLATDPTRCGPGFATTELGQSGADQLYAEGADVVFQVAGASGTGVFMAARARDGLAIGSGTDQYQQAGTQLRDTLLTSLTKKVDRAVAQLLTAAAAGRFSAGVHHDDLGTGGVGYATSGDLIGPLTGRLEADKKKIIDGEIVVPDGR